MVDKKQIWVIFLFKFKLSHKAAETTHYSNNTFGPGTTNKHPLQWWFKKFCKGDKSLEDEEHSGRPLEVDNDQLRGSLKLMHLQLHETLPKNSMPTILWLFGIWSKLERWKSSISGGLMSWLKVKKFVALKYYFIILHNNELFLDWTVTYNEKWILYNNQQWPAQWLDQEAPSTSQSQTYTQKRVIVTVWWFASGLIHHSSLNPSETITSEKYAQQTDEMHRNLQRLQPALVNRKGSILRKCLTTHCINNASKVERTGLQSFASSIIFIWPLTSWLPLLQESRPLFAGKHFHNQQARWRKCFPRIKQIPKHEFLCYRNKQTYFLMAKMCWL